MRQKFPAGIGNRRFVFGLCLQRASEQRSAFCHKLCICDLKYILYQVGIIWVLQFRVKSGQKQSRGRPYFRHLTHNFDTCKKRFTWWLWSRISLFFVPLIVGFSDVTELILLIAKSPHEITERNSSFCITDGKGTKKTPPTLVFFS